MEKRYLQVNRCLPVESTAVGPKTVIAIDACRISADACRAVMLTLVGISPPGLGGDVLAMVEHLDRAARGASVDLFATSACGTEEKKHCTSRW